MVDAWRGFFLACVIAISGCQTSGELEKDIVVNRGDMELFLSDKPIQLHWLYRPLLLEGRRNKVLNNMRVGLANLELDNTGLSSQSFDEALLGIETIYANDEKAEKARSLWFKESIKDFKGEPYERAMAYYYRGLIYLMEGDYENARASFKGGMLQDAFAEEDQNRADFAVLAFLEGWSSFCLGNKSLADDAFEEAREHNAALASPSERHNLLMIAETGSAPRKAALGDFKEKLAFSRGETQLVEKVVFNQSEQKHIAIPAEDIFQQASTRGGRPVDHVLNGKAQFKGTADVVGDVMLTAGATTLAVGAQGGSDEAAIAGAALMLGGLIAKGISGATAADADARYWDNLPDKIFLGTLEYSGQNDVTARFLDEESGVIDRKAGGLDDVVGGTPADDADQRLRITMTGKKCGLAWTRTRSALKIKDRAPGSSAGQKNEAENASP